MEPPNAERVINPSRTGPTRHRVPLELSGSVSDLLEDLEGAFKELVLRPLVVHDDERAVRCDVVCLAGHLLFSHRRGDPLPDRRTLPAVVFQQEFDPRVPVAGAEVLALMLELIK